METDNHNTKHKNDMITIIITITQNYIDYFSKDIMKTE